MYTGVPMTMPVRVFIMPGSSADSFAIPKSRIFARSPPVTAGSPTMKMFSGLRSRCTTPFACAACSDVQI